MIKMRELELLAADNFLFLTWCSLDIYLDICFRRICWTVNVCFLPFSVYILNVN